MKQEKKAKVKWIVGSIVLTIASLIVIPSLIKGLSGKQYKASLKKDNLNIDDLGPEIVRK